MKAKNLIKILEKSPEAEVTLSVSDENNHFFADRIVEITNQGEHQITIVADINKNSFTSDVRERNYEFVMCDKYENSDWELGVKATSKEDAMKIVKEMHPNSECRFKRNYAL
jgi:hypothetical protein